MSRKGVLYSLAAALCFMVLSIDTFAFFGLFNRNEGEEVFRIGFLPNEDSAAVGERRELLADEMSQALGVKVETIIVTDYNAAVEGMANGHVDLMGHGPFSYIIASERAGAEAMVITTDKPDKPETWTYDAVFIANKNSGIATLDDIEGRKFSFVDPGSTSGNLFPRSEILQNFRGLSTDDLDSGFFSEMIYSGTHDNSIMSVVHGDVDAAAVASTILDRVIDAGIVSRDDFLEIHRSKPIPSSLWAIRGDIDDDLKKKVREFMLNFDNEEYFTAASYSPESRFVEIEDSAYDVIRDTAKIMGL